MQSNFEICDKAKDRICLFFGTTAKFTQFQKEDISRCIKIALSASINFKSDNVPIF